MANKDRTFLIQFLGFLESLIPAFFVHAHNAIKKKKRQLEIKLKLAQYEIKKHESKDKLDEKFSGKSDIDTINDFLNDPKNSESQPNEGPTSE